MRLIAVIAIAIVSATTICAARRVKTSRGRMIPQAEAAQGCRGDTLHTPEAAVTITGYDKPLRSMRETFFVVNNTGRRLTAVKVTLTYHDMQGHQLHVSSHEIACDIPGGETRNASVPSWDRQRSFYYHLNRPWRPRTTATAFTVSATVDYAVCLPDK